MTHEKLDPDVTRKNDGAYWAAALVLAIRAGDRSRTIVARKELRRLGYRLESAGRKGVRRD
jgi:hypothetical protein